MPGERKIKIWGDGKADVTKVTIDGKAAEIKKGEPTTVKVPDLRGNGPWLIVVTLPDGDRAIKYEWKETRVTPANSRTDNASTAVVLGGANTTALLSVGMAVHGNGIPANTVIERIIDDTHLTLSNAAAATRANTKLSFTVRVTSAHSDITNASPAVVLGGTDTTTGLSAGMAVHGNGIPANTVIERIIDDTHLTLSNAAAATSNTTVLTFTAVTPANSTTTNASTTVVLGGADTTTGLSAGMAVDGNGIPANTVIEKIIDATHLTLSKPATATNTDTELSFMTDPIEIKKMSDADEDDVKSMIKAVDEAAESIVRGFEKSLEASIDKAAEKIAAAIASKGAGKIAEAIGR